MRRMAKAVLRASLRGLGFKLEKLRPYVWPVELEPEDIALVVEIRDRGYTMVSTERLINTVKVCRYVCESGIPGDFVECGVWRGGNGILAQKIFERYGEERQVWMFDTFAGMTQPGKLDYNLRTGEVASGTHGRLQLEGENAWSLSRRGEVESNCLDMGLDPGRIRFVVGDVCQTLADPDNVPEAIAVLRLDTDWYESTKMELETLYPQVAKGGVLVIDDYGSWNGSREAVDEYISQLADRPLLNVIDLDGRVAVKLG